MAKESGHSAGRQINIIIDVAATVNEEVTALNQTIADGNLEEIISLYPVPETPILIEIVRKLGFQTRDQYEHAVRKLLMDDSVALKFVEAQFETLVADLARK